MNLFKPIWFSSILRLAALSVSVGSTAFFGWYWMYTRSVEERVGSVCSAIGPYLQIGSTRWAEDLAKGSLSASNPELTVKISQLGFKRLSESENRHWLDVPCKVAGRSNDVFVISLSKAHGFQNWLARKLLLIILSVAAGLILFGYFLQLMFGHFIGQLTAAISQYFGISEPRIQNSYLSEGLIRFFGKLPELRGTKVAIEELSSRLQSELSNSSQLELNLSQRRFFSKYIHDIRSPLSALKIVFQKKLSLFSSEEVNLLGLTFVRLDEISDAVLRTEKSSLQQSLTFRDLLKVEDAIALVQITVNRLKISAGGTYEIDLLSEDGGGSSGKLHVTATDLDRLISNLVNNGKDAGASKVAVKISLLPSGVELKIVDNGRGGLGNDLKPKRTSSELSKVSGYGLGLEIVQEVIRKGRATGRVFSPEGVGTEITILFEISAEVAAPGGPPG